MTATPGARCENRWWQKSLWRDTRSDGVGRIETQVPARSIRTHGLERAGLCYRVRMEFDELLALLRNPGEDGLPETIYDDLSSSHALAVEGGAALVAERDGTIESLMGEVNRLKALNFDLLMAASSDDGANDDAETDPTEPPGDVTIESLFK